ncbi:MAG: hypothetical protein ACRDXX_11205 [Stackebrandtia sp.]
MYALTLTDDLAAEAALAASWRCRHSPKRTGIGRRKRCGQCGRAWGRYGCARHVWAVDLLSSLSAVLIDARVKPDRPRRRHNAAFVAILQEGAAAARRALHARRRAATARQLTPSPHRRALLAV